MRRPLLVLALLATIAAALPKAAFAKPKWPSSGSRSNHTSRVQKLARRVAAYARHQVGVAYSWGGASPATGFDCSGLVYSA
jgi:cell wall-associated NlpC family hydrolase